MPLRTSAVRARRSLVALLATLALGVAVGVPFALAAPKQVTIKGNDYDGFWFSPSPVKVIKGHRVNWSWHGTSPHNVTFGPKLNGKHSATTKNMDSFLVKFNTVGTYNYKCTVHGFKGTVVVKPPS